MLTDFALGARRCGAIVLLAGLASLSARLDGQDQGCAAQSPSASMADWSQIPPPRDGVTVTYYDGANGWIGLNRAYANSQSLTHRWRSFLPWMSPSIVSVFPFGSAYQSPTTRIPLLYVSHTAAAIDASEPDARWVHLVRADTKHHARLVQITSGWSVFKFRPGLTEREEIPLKFAVLSRGVYTVQPERPLDDGQYLVIFGQSALSGFEFRIGCSGAHRG